MPYPATLDLDAGPEVARWRPLVHWLLAVPHLLVAEALQAVGQVVALISWFAIVFTGALPAGLAAFQCLVLRYSSRSYSYAAWLREGYPPFEFPTSGADPGTDPLRVDLQPALTGRDRLRVGLRFIWMIPAVIFGALLGLALTVTLFLGFFAVVFTGRWPAGLRGFVVGAGRYLLRLGAYVSLLTDRYPPFAIDEV